MDKYWRGLVWIALTVFSTTGCVNERVYRCNDGAGLALSGRHDCNRCDSAGSCGSGCNLPPVRPFALLKRKATCGAGCGDIYWDEWFSDRPDACDPCDECSGDFIGERGCCPPGVGKTVGSFFFGNRNRHSSGCTDGSCGDCSTCGAETGVFAEDESYYPSHTSPSNPAQPTPLPKAAPKNKLPKAEPLPAPKPDAPAPEIEAAPADEPPVLPDTPRDASRKPRSTMRSASMRK